MSTPTPSRPHEEIWEATVPGRISMSITNSRGRPQEISVKGKGKRLRVTTTDRELAEEAVRTKENNPFRNGMLVRIDSGSDGNPHQPSAEELTDDDLRLLFDLDEADFEAGVSALGEVNIRRLRELTGPVNARKSQIDFLNQLIEQRYPIGGTTPSYEEMQARPL